MRGSPFGGRKQPYLTLPIAIQLVSGIKKRHVKKNRQALGRQKLRKRVRLSRPLLEIQYMHCALRGGRGGRGREGCKNACVHVCKRAALTMLRKAEALRDAFRVPEDVPLPLAVECMSKSLRFPFKLDQHPRKA